MAIQVTYDEDGSTFTLDESLELQNSASPDDGDKDDEDIARAAIAGTAFETLLFDANSLNLSSAYPDAGRIARSASNFINLTSDNTITSITLAGLDDKETAATGDDEVVQLVAYDGTNFAAGAATGPEGADLQTVDGEDIHLFSDILIDPDGPGGDDPFLAIAENPDAAIQALAGNVVFGVDENGDIAFVILMEETKNTDTDYDLGFTMVTVQALAHDDDANPDDSIDLGDFLQLSVTETGGFSFEGTPPGKSNFLMAPATSGDGGLLITSTTNVVEINTSNASDLGTTIGWGSQGINAGETVVFSFVGSGLDPDFTILPKGSPERLDQTEADDPANIVFGALAGQTGANFTIAQTVGHATQALTIAAFDQGITAESQAAGDGTFYQGLSDDVGVDITSVTITRAGFEPETFTLAESGQSTSFGVTVTFDEDFDPDGEGGIAPFTAAMISGVLEGDVVAYTTAADHHRVWITGVSGNFDIGVFEVSSTDTSTAPIGERFLVDDAAPTAVITPTGQTVVHDESTGLQDDPLTVTLIDVLADLNGTEDLAAPALFPGITDGDELLIDDVVVFTYGATNDGTMVDDLITALGGDGAIEGGDLVLTGPKGSTAEITLGGAIATAFGVAGAHSNAANDSDDPEDNNDDDQPVAALPAEFQQLDTDDAENLAAKLIGWAESFGPVVTSGDSVFDADGPASADSTVWSLDVGVDGNGDPLTDVDSGLTTLVDGVSKKILLNVETLSDGTKIVVGRVDLDGDGSVDGDDPVGVALSLTQSGLLRLAQYVPIEHGDTTTVDERATFLAGSLFAVLTVTDAEGDSHTARTDISDAAAIEDDAGTGAPPAPFVVEEDHILNGQSTGNNEDSGTDGPFRDASGNAVTDPATIDLTTALGINVGTDADAVFSLSSATADLAALATANDGLKSNGETVKWHVEGDATIGYTLIGYVDVDAPGATTGEFDDGTDREVIEWTLTSDGMATLRLLDQLDHPDEGTSPTQIAPGDKPGENLLQLFFSPILNITDAEGDPISGLGGDPVTYNIIDDVPELTVQNLVGTGTTNPQIGLWNASVGADEDGTLSLSLDQYFIGDPATLGTGVVTVGEAMVSNGEVTFHVTIADEDLPENFGFNLTFRPDGTYVIDLDGEGFGSGVTVSSADGSLDAGGPDPVRTLTIPVPDEPAQDIVFFGVAPTTSTADVFSAIGGDPDLTEAQVEGGVFGFLSPADMNVSTAGIGLGNNNFNGNEFSGIDSLDGKKGFDESFVVNPVTSVTMMKVFIDNSVGGYDYPSEELYYTVYLEDGSTPVVNHLVTDADLTMEAGGQVSFLIEWDGSNPIDAVQFTMGTGTIKIPVIEFTFPEANVVPPLYMDLTATLTDADSDSVSYSFSVDLEADDDPLAEPDFELTDHEVRVADPLDDQADVFNVDLADPANQWVITNGFDSGTDTIVLLDPGAGISLDTDNSGDDVITVGSKTITIENGADEIDGSDILIQIDGVVVSGAFLTDSDGNVNDSFVFVAPDKGPENIAGFDSSTDQIVVSAAGFGGGLVAGALPAGAFEAGVVADDANDRFIYDSTTGDLYFDADGVGGADQQLITTLDSGLAFDQDNIFVIS